MFSPLEIRALSSRAHKMQNAVSNEIPNRSIYRQRKMEVAHVGKKTQSFFARLWNELRGCFRTNRKSVSRLPIRRLSADFCSPMNAQVPVPKQFGKSQLNATELTYFSGYQQRRMDALQSVIEKHTSDFLALGIAPNESTNIHAAFKKAYSDDFDIYFDQLLGESQNQKLVLPTALLEAHQVTMHELTTNFVGAAAAEYSECMNTLSDEIEALLSASDREYLQANLDKAGLLPIKLHVNE